MRVALARLQQEVQKWSHLLGLILATALLAVAFIFVRKALQETTLEAILAYLSALSNARISLAILTTAFSYLLLTCYDQLAFRYLHQRIGRVRVAFVSFVAYSLGNTIGMANVAGSSVRLRLYTRYGVRASDVVRIIFFCSLSFWLGFLTLAGITLIVNPPELPPALAFPASFARGVGVVMSLIVLAYLGLAAMKRTPFQFRGVTLRLPSVGLSVVQLAIASADWAIAALALYWLLPESQTLTFPAFLSFFVAAQVVSLLSHVPGGVGILEATLLHLLNVSSADIPGVLGALIAYRVVYYFVPLILGASLLIVYEVIAHRKR